jgi:murein L,D-transpeptidase YafK
MRHIKKSRFPPCAWGSTEPSTRQRRARRAWRSLGQTLLLALALLAPLAAGAAGGPDTWLLIDTEARTLQIYDGESLVHTYENIAIGSNGAAHRRMLGDEQTPLGTFRIARIREETRYHRFFALNYPALDDALRAYEDGRISKNDLEAIRHAQEQGLEPPSSTPLGGNIGIHGLGKGDPKVHEDFNWTDGCIALTNEQVDDLALWIRPQMTVVIR